MKEWKRMFKRTILCVLFILSGVENSSAQIFLLNEMPRGMYFERTARVRKFKDMKDFRDVFHYDKLLLGDDIISGSISYTTGGVIVDDGETRKRIFRQSMAFYTKVRVVEEFSINTTFYKDFVKEAAPEYMSDFTYSAGRYNWRPWTWSYGYENYQPNKYSDSGEELWQKFLQGNFFFSYNVPLPRLRDIKFKRNKSDTTLITIDSLEFVKKLPKIKLSYFARYALKYRDREGNLIGGKELLAGKPTFGISARYNFYKKFYVEGAVNLYVFPNQKQPWDPDFTYGFGYFDYRAFRISVMYGNYAMNRFPWNGSKEYPDVGFLDGQFRVVTNYIW